MFFAVVCGCGCVCVWGGGVCVGWGVGVCVCDFVLFCVLFCFWFFVCLVFFFFLWFFSSKVSMILKALISVLSVNNSQKKKKKKKIKMKLLFTKGSDMKGTAFQPRVLQLNLNIKWLPHSKHSDRKNWGNLPARESNPQPSACTVVVCSAGVV